MEIDELLKNIISSINENSSKEELMILAELICEQMKLYYKYNYSDEMKERIYNLLFNYGNRTLPEDIVIRLVKMEMEFASDHSTQYESSPEYHGSYNYNANSNTRKKSQETIVDIETDILEEIISKYKGINDSVEDIQINSIPEEIATKNIELKSLVESQKSDLKEKLNNVTKQIADLMTSIAFADDGIPDIDFSDYNLKQLYDNVKDWNQSKLTKANVQFFTNMGYQVNDNVVELAIDGKQYQYNIASKMLSVDGSQKIKVEYFIPNISNASKNDLMGLSTFTNIVTDSWNSSTHTKYSTSIVVQPIFNQGDGLNPNDLSNIGETTRFINKVVENNTPNNIIVGGSQYGTYALKAAATNKGLYKTAICVNNAAIVRGVNGVKGEKAQFTSIDELNQLDGTDVVFVSAKNDPNLYYNKEVHWDKNNSNEPLHSAQNLKKGYLYTGVQTVLANCPDSNVTVITNSDFVQEFTNLSNSSNYHYKPEMWNEYGIGSQYTGHAYAGILESLMMRSFDSNNTITKTIASNK